MSGCKRKNVKTIIETDSESENDNYPMIRKGDSRKTNKCVKKETKIKTEFNSNINQEKAESKSLKRKLSEIPKKVNIKEEPELDDSDFEASSRVNIKKIKKEKLGDNLRGETSSAKIEKETYSDVSDTEDLLNIKNKKYGIKKEIYSDTSDSENSLTIKNEKINIKTEKDVKRKLKSKIKNESNVKNQNHLNKYKGTKTKENVVSKINDATANQLHWEDDQLFAEYQNLDLNISRNIVGLFNEGCTIPFIARYRKDMTNNMTPEILREAKCNYDKIIVLKSRMQTVLNCLEKNGNLNVNMKKTILNAKSIEEVEHIYAPFKPGSKRTLAERARALGLQKPAEDILENKERIAIYKYVDKGNNELDTYDKVEKGVIHIIAHIISMDIKILTFLRKLKTQGNFRIEVKKLTKRATKTTDSSSQEPDESKYENYFDFKMPVKCIKPHQVLAINRGESQKILSVKIIAPEFILGKFTGFCKEKFMFNNCVIGTIVEHERQKILDAAIKDAYTRLMQPLLVREIRSELKLNAEKASYDVFCSNLKQLLLTSPIKGRSILGIDPGFSNGCKAALISPTGSLLTSNVFYLHTNKSAKEAKVLKDMLLQYNCSLIAVGNGTACRETETWLSDLISKNYLLPLDVSYIIVNENGASIYSCSPEAQKEFPTLDPNIISAVSLARRVQEPLAEFVKVEPRHLGVGMYQHDLPKKKLNEALNEVVSECVSFVGVDLNTASQCLLRRVAGLSDNKATKIIEYRDGKGPFINRKDLFKISGIGSKIFEQCVGFLRVGPITVDEESDFYKNPNSNKLDCTIIHPESYDLTAKLLKQFKLKLSDIGTDAFISSIKEKVNTVDLKALSESFETSEETLKLIFDALGKPLNYDLRNDCSKVPLFKKGVTNVCDLHVGTILTGRINNVTHFGSFVDIGIGINGLIHTSKMKGQNLHAGNTVEVRVINIEIQRKRIGLELVQVI